MPKKQNSLIRAKLLDLHQDVQMRALDLRDQADQLDMIATAIMYEAEELHNAKPLKPRTKKHAPKVTKAMARNIKALAMAGWSSADIAAHFGINQGRITDVLNGNYGV